VGSGGRIGWDRAAGGRDRTGEIAVQWNGRLRLQDGRTAERQTTLTFLISSIDIEKEGKLIP
jgi:hypothetical protein